jgi:hypothetical protein
MGILKKAQANSDPPRDVKGGPHKTAQKNLSPNSWVGILLVSLSAVALWQTIQQALTRDLTGLETTLFSAITFVLSSLGSFIVSAHFNQLQARKEYEQLARPALRRVDSLQQALTLVAAGVNARIKKCQGPAPESAEELIWLQGLMTQLQLLSHNIKDANSDWREMLPEDYEDALRRAFDELGDSRESINKLTAEIDAEKAKKAAGDKDAQAKIARLEHDLSEQRRAAAWKSIDLTPAFKSGDFEFTFSTPVDGRTIGTSVIPEAPSPKNDGGV